MRPIALALVLGVLSVPALAADDEYRRCIDKSDGTNVAWSECGYAMLKRADDRLNAAWKTAIAAMPGEASRKALLDEQRAWIAYKEKSCTLYAGDDFGREGQVLSYPGCRADVIDARTKFLQSLKNGD